MNNSGKVNKMIDSITFVHVTSLGFLPPMDLLSLHKFVQLPLQSFSLSRVSRDWWRFFRVSIWDFKSEIGWCVEPKDIGFQFFKALLVFFQRDWQTWERIVMIIQVLCVIHSLKEGWIPNTHMSSNQKYLGWDLRRGLASRKKRRWSKALAVRWVTIALRKSSRQAKLTSSWSSRIWMFAWAALFFPSKKSPKKTKINQAFIINKAA